MDGINYESMSEAQQKEYFDKNYNISYVDENLPIPDKEILFKHYIASAFIYGLALVLFIFNPFYIKEYNGHSVLRQVVLYAYFGYLLLAPIFLLIFKPKTAHISHSVEVVNYLIKLVKFEGLEKNISAKDFIKWLMPTYRQKQSLILFFIKFYFAPLIVVWSVSHLQSAMHRWEYFIQVSKLTLFNPNFNIDLTNQFAERYSILFYGIIVDFLYFLDCFVFSIGYCTELTIFKNRIRTVESTPLGLTFCLLCYPLFINILGTIAPWPHYENGFSCLLSDYLNISFWACMFVELFFITIYCWASVALFTRASNLTNRGMVSRFPYNIIRHPAYTAKISMWLIGSICPSVIFLQNGKIVEFIGLIFAALLWTFVYFMRAMTEERHLYLDPEYRAYCKKVKYRFIPKVI